MYGATEASARLTYLDPEFFESKMDSIGKPVAGVTIRIMDDQNREMPDGREGELVASGPNIMMGYWKDPQETCRVLDTNGYHTGDMGYRDAEGFLFISNRKDGLVKVGGHRINPVEIEDFLMGTDLLVESVLVPVPDPLLGHKLVALVVPKEEITGVQNIMQICSAGLPHHKVPADVIITRTLPKNANAKIDLNKCLETVLRKQNGKKKAS
jgi:long-chain acyl-CoA synthetase